MKKSQINFGDTLGGLNLGKNKVYMFYESDKKGGKNWETHKIPFQLVFSFISLTSVPNWFIIVYIWFI